MNFRKCVSREVNSKGGRSYRVRELHHFGVEGTYVSISIFGVVLHHEDILAAAPRHLEASHTRGVFVERFQPASFEVQGRSQQ